MMDFSLRLVRWTLIFSAVLSIAVLSPVLAQDSTPRDLLYAEAAAARPEIEHFRLRNGIDVWFARRQGTGKLRVKMVLSTIGVASCRRPAGSPEIMAALIARGTESHTKRDLDAYLGKLGGSLASAGSEVEAFLELNARTDNLDKALALWAESARSPVFRESQMQEMKEKYAASLSAAALNPRDASSTILDRALWGSCAPFGQMTTPQSVTSIQRADIINSYADLHESSRAFIIAIGDIGSQKLKSDLEASLDGWLPRNRPFSIDPISVPNLSPRVILVDNPGAPEVLIRAGRVVPAFDPKNEAAINLFISVIGQSAASRLYTNITAERGWAYFSGAYFRTKPRSRSLIIKASEVKVGYAVKAIQEIFKEMRDISDINPITDEEIERERGYLIRNLEEITWSDDEIVLSWLQFIAQNNLSEDYFLESVNALRTTSRAEVHDAGNRILPDMNLTWVITGDLSRIERGVRELHIGEVEVQDIFGRRVR